MFEDRIPYVGQMVHYKSHDTGECRPAIVTAQGEENLLNLCVMNSIGIWFSQNVNRDETAGQGGTWHWFKQ